MGRHLNEDLERVAILGLWFSGVFVTAWLLIAVANLIG